MGSNDLPYLHGGAHRPGGSDPSLPGPFHYISNPAVIWDSGTDFLPGDQVADSTYNYVCLLANGPSVSPAPLIFEPGVTLGWPTYWIIDVPLFQNGWANMAPTLGIPDPVPMGYCLVVGPLNILDRDTGDLVEYSDHRIDIAGDVTGGATGTAVFTIPPAYRLPQDKPVPGHDDTMAYVASRLFSAGNFVRGTA